jgi:hypothetical protein
MRKRILGLVLLTVAASAADGIGQYTGVITDTMCAAKHAMGITPDSKCVQDCVKTDLSDQQTPEKFAAQRVKVTGLLFEKTKILRADKIEAVR